MIKIIDIKCPDSGEGHTFCWENIALAAAHDEFKFVIASRKDYEWSRDVVRNQLQGSSNTILFSPAHEEMPPRQLAEWVLADGLPVRVQLQIHKYIWGADVRGRIDGEIFIVSLFNCHLSFCGRRLLSTFRKMTNGK